MPRSASTAGAHDLASACAVVRSAVASGEAEAWLSGGTKRKPSGPGSKASYSYHISPTELFYCGVVLKTDEIAQYAKNADLCWPVVMSKKKGGEALELCPDFKAHGGMKAACHIRPKNFDIDHMYKNFTRAPTPDEYKAAGWGGPNKRGKKKA